LPRKHTGRSSFHSEAAGPTARLAAHLAAAGLYKAARLGSGQMVKFMATGERTFPSQPEAEEAPARVALERLGDWK
jgi:hypothetical protein